MTQRPSIAAISSADRRPASPSAFTVAAIRSTLVGEAGGGRAARAQCLGHDRRPTAPSRSCRRPPRWARAASPRFRVILAEELDADWSKVKLSSRQPDTKLYGNPIRRRLSDLGQLVGARLFQAAAIAGAQARRVLLDAVAAKWDVPVGELTTEPSVVVHKASGRRIGYGEIAAFAKAPAELPKIEDKDLKPAATSA